MMHDACMPPATNHGTLSVDLATRTVQHNAFVVPPTPNQACGGREREETKKLPPFSHLHFPFLPRSFSAACKTASGTEEPPPICFFLVLTRRGGAPCQTNNKPILPPPMRLPPFCQELSSNPIAPHTSSNVCEDSSSTGSVHPNQSQPGPLAFRWPRLCSTPFLRRGLPLWFARCMDSLRLRNPFCCDACPPSSSQQLEIPLHGDRVRQSRLSPSDSRYRLAPPSPSAGNAAEGHFSVHYSYREHKTDHQTTSRYLVFSRSGEKRVKSFFPAVVSVSSSQSMERKCAQTKQHLLYCTALGFQLSPPPHPGRHSYGVHQKGYLVKSHVSYSATCPCQKP